MGSVDTQNNKKLKLHSSVIGTKFLIIFNGSYHSQHMKISFEPDSYCGPVGLIDLNVSDSDVVK